MTVKTSLSQELEEFEKRQACRDRIKNKFINVTFIRIKGFKDGNYFRIRGWGESDCVIYLNTIKQKIIFGRILSTSIYAFSNLLLNDCCVGQIYKMTETELDTFNEDLEICDSPYQLPIVREFISEFFGRSFYEDDYRGWCLVSLEGAKNCSDSLKKAQEWNNYLKNAELELMPFPSEI